ncbi:hypothetical protein BMW23_0398 [Bodo saltans virus]|uniref:Uncharacterized protein n=1 Tax=Bodo saltans virus TaxID=2024608 RepID=A0A2H4UU42_9VIRU|nr:hypothetical protein QJ851_gp0389 [Bodo saltans virus]ATZ80452.1 hypothetical protein BMW23_0398 [Bodo saltans virus]
MIQSMYTEYKYIVYIEILMNYRPYGLLNYYFKFYLYGDYFMEISMYTKY